MLVRGLMVEERHFDQLKGEGGVLLSGNGDLLDSFAELNPIHHCD